MFRWLKHIDSLEDAEKNIKRGYILAYLLGAFNALIPLFMDLSEIMDLSENSYLVSVPGSLVHFILGWLLHKKRSLIANYALLILSVSNLILLFTMDVGGLAIGIRAFMVYIFLNSLRALYWLRKDNLPTQGT
ncbi:hypothetical protein GF360_00980 [candidate division WWE3 bacterium]|nr:hypothetical protein [candidate division WWE3 bacterium]